MAVSEMSRRERKTALDSLIRAFSRVRAEIWSRRRWREALADARLRWRRSSALDWAWAEDVMVTGLLGELFVVLQKKKKKLNSGGAGGDLFKRRILVGCSRGGGARGACIYIEGESSGVGVG